MPGTTSGTDPRPATLRVVPWEGEEPIALSDRRVERRSGSRPGLRLVEHGSPILIAGEHSPRRAALLADLAETLPEGTVFEELTTLAGVLERAPASRMVILDGLLEEISGSAVARILGQRHPALPVINLDLSGPDEL
jgi:hypothetical protein